MNWIAIQLVAAKGYWIGSDGVVERIDQMHLYHIQNAIKKLEAAGHSDHAKTHELRAEVSIRTEIV